MSRHCKKQKIDELEALEIFRSGYGLKVQVMNFYQFRISDEEHENIFFDWYHTTGSLVICKDGYNKALDKFLDSENLAIFIKNYNY